MSSVDMDRGGVETGMRDLASDAGPRKPAATVAITWHGQAAVGVSRWNLSAGGVDTEAEMSATECAGRPPVVHVATRHGEESRPHRWTMPDWPGRRQQLTRDDDLQGAAPIPSVGYVRFPKIPLDGRHFGH
ncbi:hypothetical protein FRAHR75_80015 [Frankia sp. Hr75.2]|nr:hypothetical protein FRAHR75_80015 [Frankia sp. Hr75.2]